MIKSGSILGVRMLSQFDGVRANNFTLIRLIFASAVLFGHSYPIAGKGVDPLSQLMAPYMWIGEIAVDGFFGISGFLVTASVMRRDLTSFAVSRILRIYPAIIVYFLIAACILGPMASYFNIVDYFSNPYFWYFLSDVTLWQHVQNPPHVFPDRPFPGAFNGSLWTLPAEIRCYIFLFALGFLGIFERRIRSLTVIGLMIYLTIFNFSLVPLFGLEPRFDRPLLCFLYGSLAWQLRAYIPMNAILAIAILLAPWLLFLSSAYFFPIFAASLVYLVLYVAYCLPHVDVDRYGDYSFGIYIYAWPIQQLVWWPGQAGAVNALLAALIVFPMGWASWTFIEKPALALAGRRRRSRPSVEAPAEPATQASSGAATS